MNITARDLCSRPRRIGSLGGDPVWELETTGGLYVVTNQKGKPLGFGSHRAIARHIAKQTEPDIQLTDLQKSDHVPEEHYRGLLSKYEQLTLAARAAFDRG